LLATGLSTNAIPWGSVHSVLGALMGTLTHVRARAIAIRDENADATKVEGQ
jgi:hypothetical protein